MPFEIELGGTVQQTVHRQLADLLGGDAVMERGGRLVLCAQDQSAMIGVLVHVHDLGLDVTRVAHS